MIGSACRRTPDEAVKKIFSLIRFDWVGGLGVEKLDFSVAFGADAEAESVGMQGDSGVHAMGRDRVSGRGRPVKVWGENEEF